GLLASLSDNPLLLPGAAVLVLLLGGLGLYKLRGRGRKPAGETSFLESRLQPDSFFGASGGQRIDTRDATTSSTGSSSSMSYSLSQLDAIGDVDPVAEADVYLAYGRDLQAEEILKEAMRADPERMAIRSKLLEVYAKRRDTKGFELLATQMFSLTRGEGEDWAKAQAMGQSIDPDNRLYQPGGAPDEVIGAHGRPVEALGASTVPYTAPATPVFQPAADATLSGEREIDLALDLELPAERTAPLPVSTMDDHNPPTLPAGARARPSFDMGLETDPDVTVSRSGPVTGPAALDVTVPIAPPRAPAPTAPAPLGDGLDFDLGELSNSPPPAAPGREAAVDFGDFSIDGTESQPVPLNEPAADADALSRKLELAEEFRQIGDLEGARDLLEEVLARADGALRSKAQKMLESL
ncbi:MAG: hypothetical protein H7Z19_17925, partial [Chitinophagaceae bacterium]|nr:hypothetical protein [Rubrivivax sp.]